MSRGFAWVNEDIEHDEADYARASALAKKWSALTNAEEQRIFRRMAEYEDGNGRDEEACEDCAACEAGDYGQCEYILEMARKTVELQAERDLEIELIEDKLEAIGARMMRLYEHWNEEERYMEYAERER